MEVKSELTFATFTSASLPSGVYLFFPALDLPPLAPDGHPLQRLVLSTSFAGDWRERFSGFGSGNTLHVDLDPDEFMALLAELAPNRDYQRHPIVFNVVLNDAGTLEEFAIGAQSIERFRQAESGPPIAMTG